MVVHDEGEIMPTEQDPTMELSMVSKDLTLLHCPLCLCPLKPQVYECKGGHLACADCRVDRLGNHRQCQKCERGGGFDVRNTVVDADLSSVRVECPHEGCGLHVTYHKLADHQSVCPLVPCKCPVPVCIYEGPPPALSHHIITMHPMPVHRIQYGKVLQLQVPLSEPRLLLFVEEDGSVFFLVGGVLDIGAPIAVSVICIRAGASPLPHYMAKLWANGPPGEPKGRTDAIKVEMEVTSSKDPGDVTVQELTFFTVPPKLLAGAGLSRMVSLHIQIDKLTS
ncbi:E3 ubiquitin-protein ligase SINA-like 10 [Aegilops tauschii subsp. strangulata]|uniref:E3 ubiquitin-protein ligase SINA-like 10 n=1 Tax=Aegilops tauschii subsp. strangulata TaxID=200361 RepID=UPI001ABCF038|nr:E3 ubiquitin-protein ligase SINA-like 10 [Aegilops tauschii subsp. strangulata]